MNEVSWVRAAWSAESPTAQRRARISLVGAALVALLGAASCGGGGVVEKVREALPGPSDPLELLANRVGICESSSILADEAFDEVNAWWDFRFAPDASSLQFFTNYEMQPDGGESIRLDRLEGQTIKLAGGGEGEVSSLNGSSGDGRAAELELTWSEVDGKYRLGDLGRVDSLDRSWFEADADSFKQGEAEISLVAESNGTAETTATMSCRFTGDVEPPDNGTYDPERCSLEIRPLADDEIGPGVVGCGRAVVLTDTVLNSETSATDWLSDTSDVRTPPTAAVILDVDGCQVSVGEQVPVVGSQAGDGMSTELDSFFWQTVTVFESEQVAEKVARSRNAVLEALAEGCDASAFPDGSLIELTPSYSSSRLFGDSVAKVDHPLPQGVTAWTTGGGVVVVLQAGTYYSELWLDSATEGAPIRSADEDLISRALARMAGQP